ncbi:hypothetical protein GWK08_10575 [Leptobacterium flavescens]|uniref:DUF3052 family protein n=1 Tax=Leptobacterium flavescens TaxID=472055 RepID=A0A6P0UTY6_9FLAO|nr:hypothetical protein [Leptobacterium flavescens]NER13886.1 hypothetical protein [Leptobacterium flavescens]
MCLIVKQLRLNKQNEIIILNQPEDLSIDLKKLEGVTIIRSLVKTSCVEFALVFIDSKEQLERQMMTLFPRLLDSSVLWIAYPNTTSRKLIDRISAEIDWTFLDDYRLQPTRKASLHENWEAIKWKIVKI